MKKLSSLLCLSLLLAGCATQTSGPRPRVIKDLVYAKRGEHQLKLDLYLPPEIPAKPVPLIVWVHGGGWKGGNKNNCKIDFLALEGFAVASVEYRLAGKSVFPAQVADLRQSIRWLKSQASRYQLNPGRIGLMGESAGGHLTDLVALAPEKKEWNEPGDPVTEVRVSAAVSLFGPTELGSLVGGIERASRNAWVGPLIGRENCFDPKNINAASPIHYVTSDDPPFLLMHGDKDWFVPPAQSETLADKLFEAGVPVTYILVPGRGHGMKRSDYEKQVRSFFNGWLKQHPAK